MNEEEAYLIVRMAVALADEGIGPNPEIDGDGDLITEAVKISWDRMDPVQRYWWEDDHESS